jgi:hypothetical protein
MSGAVIGAADIGARRLRQIISTATIDDQKTSESDLI